MSLFHFSAAVVRLLRASGWKPSRNVDVTDVLRAIELHGFNVNEHASAFLREFFGLTITAADDDWASFTLPDIQAAVPEYTERLEQFVGEKLCPVGCIQMATMFVSASGQVYTLAFDWVSSTRSRTIEEAFEVFFGKLNKTAYETIYYDDDDMPVEKVLARWATEVE